MRLVRNPDNRGQSTFAIGLEIPLESSTSTLLGKVSYSAVDTNGIECLKGSFNGYILTHTQSKEKPAPSSVLKLLEMMFPGAFFGQKSRAHLESEATTNECLSECQLDEVIVRLIG